MNTQLRLSERTIKALGKVVTGDERLSPYRNGPNLVALFNELGSNDVYGQGFPSRWAYTEDSIRKINEKSELFRLIEMVFDPREFLNTEFDLPTALEFFNKYFAYEKYQVVLVGGYAKVRDLNGVDVDFLHPFQTSNDDAHIFIDEQVKKCDEKISSGDYYGAITNARSLVEAVLAEIEKDLDADAPGYDGDLVKLYRRVTKLMNLGPERKDISDTLKQVLTGLNSIIAGLAGLRNKMSDAHVASYKPSKHHAKLAVNSAKTVCDFLFESKQYQQRCKMDCL